ncbi:hypothetical protein OROGR_019468 [Orobanche gracilis]
MKDTKSSLFSSFKSNKQLHSPEQSDQKTRKGPQPDQNPWTVKTPGKSVDPPRRLRNRGAAMSIKEVREAAMRLRRCGSVPSARIDPVAESEVEHVAKSKMSAGSKIKLPEKYELLEKFFNTLDSSIRLLQLKRTATTFTNISPQIEILTDRRFTYSHLAQLKYLMPEVIMVEKVQRHDERTSCMKPDLRITLNVKAVEIHSKSESLSCNLQMRKVFHRRILDFFKFHPEGDEVPEEALPEPFNRWKETACSNSVLPSTSSSTSETPDTLFQRQPVSLSHTSLSFKPFFMKRGSGNHIENLKQDPSVYLEDKSARSPSEKENNATAAESRSKKSSLDLSGIMLSTSPETPVKCINSTKDDDQTPVETISVLRTPVGLASTPAKLMSVTPALNPPKRCCLSPDDSPYRSPSKLVRRPPANRPLKFDTPVKGAKIDLEFVKRESPSTDDDILDILPDALIQSIRKKERLATLERDPAISQAKQRRKMIASLPKRFDTIYYLFQSIRRSVVTKEELIQKVITGDPNVIDRGEVEEQLRLLRELAPDWIYEKSMLSGDLMICVNKISSPEAIRTRLSEAQ